ncbi:hypothetical protein ACOSP7_001965 [Xanthoceras sorbifolium]
MLGSRSNPASGFDREPRFLGSRSNPDLGSNANPDAGFAVEPSFWVRGQTQIWVRPRRTRTQISGLDWTALLLCLPLYFKLPEFGGLKSTSQFSLRNSH